mmetsp:Transcript_8315/g.10700  ORF Transcript_8315/g.10700 Transcript_8315/m.10700 type:complete len:91 (-) Transcript_8315:94-366(-)
MGRKMAAAKRRISVSYLVGQANKKMIPDEINVHVLRIRSYECTGCMITRDVDKKLDKKIRRSFLSKYQRKHFLLIQMTERRYWVVRSVIR